MSLQEVVDEYWRTTFGVHDGGELWPNGVHLVPHGPSGTIATYEGIWIVAKDNAVRISAPHEKLSEAAGRIAAASNNKGLTSGELFRSLYADAVVTLGPSLHGYASVDMLHETRRWKASRSQKSNSMSCNTCKPHVPTTNGAKEGSRASRPATLLLFTAIKSLRLQI